MTAFVLMLVMAVTVEALVQYTKTVIDAVAKKKVKTAVTQLAALLVSVTLCILAGADIYAALGVPFMTIGGRDWAGLILTGVFASRGANYAADILKCLQSAAQGKLPPAADKQ